jgi:spore germination protein YaaH
MKKSSKLLVVYLLIIVTVIVYACTKIDIPAPEPINLGVKSESTAIKSFVQSGNSVTAEFETTIGAKYSVQIIPFGKEEPVKKEGFTATEELTKKVYDLSGLTKQDYDLIFIDIKGKEVKHPIIIK